MLVKYLRTIAIVVLALALLVGVVVSSEFYLNQTNIECGREDHKSAAQKEPTQINPALKQLVPSDYLDKYPAEPKETRYECLIAKYTSELAVFTKVLAYATVSLVLATIGLLIAAGFQSRDMKESLRTAKQSADAADRSARAAIGIELPVIRLRPDSVSLGDGISMEGGEYEHLSIPGITISNLGKTKAFPVEVLYGWTIGEFLPKEPTYEFVDRFLPNLIIEPTPTITPFKRLTMAKPLQEGERAKILGGNYCWFYCDFRYDDFMDERRGHAFCWRWASKGGGGLEWVEERIPAYNRKS
jgi:hypothetical protein